MNATQTIEAINAHLDECPTDWTARLELADLLEDDGRDNEARYQRWAAKYRKTPEMWDKRIKQCNHWHWWKLLGDKANSVGEELGSRLSFLYRGYGTRQDAEADLMRALIAHDWPAPLE